MPYAEIAVGSKRLVHAVRMAAVLSLGSSAVSALLAFYLTFVGAYSALTPVSMLLYLLLWRSRRSSKASGRPLLSIFSKNDHQTSKITIVVLTEGILYN